MAAQTGYDSRAERDRRLDAGRRLQSAGSFAEAEAIYRELLAEDPHDFEALHLLGVLSHQQGDHLAAITALRDVLGADPGFVPAWQNLVLPLVELDRLDEAIDCGRHAVRLAPEKAGVRTNLARALIQAGHHDEARTVVEESLALTPDDPTSLCQLGHLKLLAKDAAGGEALFARAIAIAPGHVEAHYNRGVALQALLDDEGAVAAYRRALALDPAHRAARLNLGVALRALGRIGEALAAWRGFDIDPETWPELAYNTACAHLLAGDWRAAWAGYDHRLTATTPFAHPPATLAPIWDGSPAPEDTLLVHHEQGLGDTVQFVRLLPAILDRVGAVILVCQPALAPLLASLPFAGEGSGRVRVVADGRVLPDHDLWLPLLSLPRLLDLDRETVPTRVPYLAAEADRIARWSRRLDDIAPRAGGVRLRVGLVWQGNPDAPVEKGRSIPLTAFAPLGVVGGVAFVALQKGPGREQVAPEGLTLLDPGDGFDEGPGAFLDTAALVATLDLVITSDTSIAHVVGALGRPVWLLAKKVPEWRWGLEGEISPWYPTLRVFRQDVAGDWRGPMATVARDLAALVALGTAPIPAAVKAGGDADSWFEAAVAAHARGRADEARDLFARVAAARPLDARAFNFHGMAAIEAAGNAGPALLAALPIVCHSVALAPGGADLAANLAVLLKRLGRIGDARLVLLHALRIAPDHRAAGLNLINLEVAAGRFDVAEARALDWASRHADDAGIQAAASEALRAAGRLDEALVTARRAVTLAPDEARHRVHLGRILSALDDADAAARAWEEALALSPTLADALSNLGVHERNHGETGLAVWFARAAVAADPAHADAWSNLGIAAGEREIPEEARAAFARAIALRPDHADARMAHGMSLLAEGRFEEGLADYDWRLRSTRLGLDNRPARLAPWAGEDPTGRRFLILAEQGFGDAIQFVRYAAMLKARGAREVFVGCRRRLAALLARAEGVDGIVAEGDTLPAVDFSVHMMSLPHRCGTTLATIPGAPYLSAEPERVTRWARRLSARDGFRVGLVWQGNPDPTVDRGRSLPLAALEPLGRIPGVRLIALQKGPGCEQIADIEGRFRVETLGDDFDEGPDAFLDSAAVMANLDLVIATDTAVPHLAGALGRPTWVLLKAQPEWRWLTERCDSPWYPSARLFRQDLADPRDGDRWGPVVERLAGELARLVDGDRSRLVDATPAASRVAAPLVPIDTAFAAALAAHRAGRFDEARHGYAEILARAGDHGEALHMTGVLAIQDGHQARALVFLRAAERCGCRTPEQRTNLAVALKALGSNGEAERLLRGVMAEAPSAEAALALGNLLRDRDRTEEALEIFVVAERFDPDSAKICRSLGNTLRDGGRLDEAIEVLDRAVGLDPTDAEARLDRAHALLQAGRLEAGFADYEWRWRSGEMRPHPHAETPQWDGAAFEGRTLLVHGEQGLGDHIQFARFIADAAERGGRVVVEVRRPLLGLFAALKLPEGRSIEVVEQGGATPPYDLQIPLLSLPFVLGLGLLDLPWQTGYITAERKRVTAWRKRLAPDGRLRIGLVWQGNPTARADRGRSPPLAALAPLATRDDVRIVALQKEHGLDQLADAAFADRIERPGADFDAGPDAFLDTAAAMSAVDLVVTSDTAAAHLAGALGRPTFLMLKHAADWRWMTDRDDSPWYPSLRLFRQPSPGDWASVVAAIVAALPSPEKRRAP